MGYAKTQSNEKIGLDLKEIKKVMVSMSGKTLQDINSVSDIIGDSNRSNIVAKAVQVLKFLSEEISEGGELIIKEKDGDLKKVQVLGL